jgi:chemotaxis protein methyltransferase CheR
MGYGQEDTARLGREYAYTDRHFEFLRELVERSAGIKISDVKRELVYGRVVRRIRKLGLEGFDAYCALVERDAEERTVHFINAITTNLTSFFREPHHFDFLGKTVLPELRTRNQASRRIRIWSAGCSTGEEPYSIAMTIREAIPDLRAWDVRILATDIDSTVLEKAQSGIYEQERLANLSPARLGRWFLRGKGDNDGMARVVPEIQELITFRRLNLMEPWPLAGQFDVIFCRNVVIYFDKDTQKVLFNRFADALLDDGWLFIGHSENLFRVSERFELLGHTVYRKIKDSDAGALPKP